MPQDDAPSPPDHGPVDAQPVDRRTFDRRSIWLAVAGALGIIVGIVALVIAISAKNATTNNAKLTAQVNQDARQAVGGVHAQLQHDVASATSVLHALEASSASARGTDAALRRDLRSAVNRVAANRGQIQSNAGEIHKLQASINALNADVQHLGATQTTLAAGQAALTKQVKAIVSSSTTTTSSSG